MTEKLKKTIQYYWTQNVPGLDLIAQKYTPEQKEFYTETDAHRYKYDSYIPALIDSFVKEGRRVLEIGCGMGTDSRYISKHGSDIISLDLSHRNVAFTLKGMQILQLKGKGVNADAERLPFKDNSFDIVYSFGVLHHTPDTQKAINEAYRVLKPNGKCVIMLYHKGYAYYALWLLHGYKRLFGLYSQDKFTSRYDNTPLSRMYSKKEIRDIFSNFKGLDLSMTTFGGAQRHPVLKYVHALLHKSKFLMNRFGSFIIIRGKKTGDKLCK